MNAMFLMMSAVEQTVPQKAMQTTSKNGQTSFGDVLGQFMIGNEQETVETLAEPSMLEQLFAILTELNYEELFLQMDEEAKEKLIALLPEEWQEELLLFFNEEKSFEDLPVINQLIATLMMASQAIQTIEDGDLRQQVKRLATNVFPAFTFSEGDEDALNHTTKQLQQLMSGQHQSTKSEETLIQLLTTKKQDAFPLPSGFRPQAVTFETVLQQSSNGQEFAQVMTKAEQAVIHIGEHLPKQVQEQQFMRQLQMILNRAQLQQQAGMNSLSIKLYPEHLGRLDIQLTQIEGAIVAKILASSTASRELIESQLAQLRQTFIQQQIPVERIEVSEQYLGKEKEEQSARDEQKHQQDETNEEDQALLFNEWLDEFSFDEEV